MTTVLAAIDSSPAADPVLRSAQALAATLGAEVRAIHVAEDDVAPAESAAAHAGVGVTTLQGDPVATIIDAVADPDLVAVVIGARRHPTGRRPVGHVAQAVMTGTSKPVLVVPPDVHQPSAGRFRRALVPLDGSAESGQAVEAIVGTLIAAGVAIVAVHVFRPDTVPRFWDQAGHADQSWTAEFLARCCHAAPSAELHLRTGDIGGATLDVANNEVIDLIVLGWSQHLQGDRARVVRDIVGRAEVAVLLAPTPAAVIETSSESLLRSR